MGAPLIRPTAEPGAVPRRLPAAPNGRRIWPAYHQTPTAAARELWPYATAAEIQAAVEEWEDWQIEMAMDVIEPAEN